MNRLVVMILEKVPVALRGELSRWMIEPRAGVFIGSLSALVRDRLWDHVCQKSRDGGCTMAYRSNNEQGFLVRVWGDTSRVVEDFEGLALVRQVASR
jgi:CRISPR-associated protein Cas2